MQVGDEPVAVTLPFSFGEKGTLLALKMSLFQLPGMGKPLKRQGSQKTCLNQIMLVFVDRNQVQDLEDKKGMFPDRFIIDPVFFACLFSWLKLIRTYTST